ncbi:hypothetical protein [Deinococcus sp. UYEF24]
MQNKTSAYFIDHNQSTTDLGTYQKAHEARGACTVQSDRELKWVKRLDGVWEAELDGSLYRLVVTRDQ